MLLHVPEVLNADELAQCRRRLAQAPWGDGRVTAGHQSALAKHNLQLPEGCAEAGELGALVEAALARNTTFFAGALPRHIFPPLFNCYRGGQSFGMHIDNAIRYDRRGDTSVPVRTDLSATLFLNDPEEYDGGDLVIDDTYGSHTVKLAAGDMILYPASSLHRVEPVTRGERVAAFFWIQSLVRDEAQRRLLLELDISIQSLGQANAPQADVLRLTGVYHNLLRAWSAT
ncbi:MULTISPECIES: Fe2+-dependent dioxygenase [unclassified Dyella]|uniref:Fe2+-dependent dioxygenase n=1 Tax=unclassified Dyella TaxID=2634549 RepID=UPI000C84C86E|nr:MULTISPECIES: Fe2+-dependent dioxygenase [unclassified Dyella]MDR3445550.1 Fe2+-dependent dioxygenase [Dyella sp.]PMQ05224.1 PKHD-type hydroxylase [Dyella sp. AD56]